MQADGELRDETGLIRSLLTYRGDSGGGALERRLHRVEPGFAPVPTRADDVALIAFTSGTTGRPKGCVLPNEYFLRAGGWYAGLGGLAALHPGAERMLTPLPLFHMNALAYSAMAMLATGGSMAHTIRLLTERGATDVTAICVLAAPEGIAHLRASGLPVRVITASVDERLNDSAFIVPGLGDAGDRQFGAV